MAFAGGAPGPRDQVAHDAAGPAAIDDQGQAGAFLRDTANPAEKLAIRDVPVVAPIAGAATVARNQRFEVTPSAELECRAVAAPIKNDLIAVLSPFEQTRHGRQDPGAGGLLIS